METKAVSESESVMTSVAVSVSVSSPVTSNDSVAMTATAMTNIVTLEVATATE